MFHMPPDFERRVRKAAFVEWWRYLVGSPQSRIRQRQALDALDDRLLRDVGLQRGPDGVVSRFGRRAIADADDGKPFTR